MTIDGALPYLRCPVCAADLDRTGGSLRCGRGHAFDIARQGYVNLTAGRCPHSGDTTAMITDREAFLAAGHYDFIADALVAEAGLVLDAGTGTGFYLSRVLDGAPYATGLGLDVSKPALRRAARAHPRAATALADLWQRLPLADGSVSVILDVFAPRNGPEFARVLRPDGRLLVVTPAADHLRELIEAYDLIGVDPDKNDRTRASLGDAFTEVDRITLRHTLSLTAAEVRTLIGMTPNARHHTGAATSGLAVGAAVHLTTYRPA